MPHPPVHLATERSDTDLAVAAWGMEDREEKDRDGVRDQQLMDLVLE